MATLFFSYSHVDELLRDQLEVHLSSLKRQGLISAWHDRRIVAGTEWKNEIDKNLEAAEVVLLLISPDFINSDYCFELEMKRAMERHQSGEAKVIPVILRPCDWHDLQFGKLQAVPKDGKAITTLPNIDQAFLDVVRAIKGALNDLGEVGKTVRPPVEPLRKIAGPLSVNAGGEGPPSPRSSNLRIKKQFTELDLDRFRQDGFEFISKFFENTMKELVDRNPGLDQRFQRIDATTFTAALYRNGEKVCKGSASVSDGMMGKNAIQYVMTDTPGRGSMNEAVYAKADDQTLYFESLGMQVFGNRDKEKLTAQGAAELFWELFVRPLQ